ncbi:ribonuclease HII [Angustibacter sp. McL0619]|uniref:ribonuclease HII n=1 Tax=Angustibacter sp. McL0619 TaxID=3415676 RepID=UPI003CF3EEAE
MSPAGRAPSLRTERSLLRDGCLLLAAVDEVGRGALAGPASVGIVLVDATVRTAPSGVRDSKLLTPAARQALVPRIHRWALASAVGHAGPDEVDAVGILGALRAAARRALAALPAVPDLVLLDGSHDWLTDPTSDGLLAFAEDAVFTPPVRTMVKADLKCSSVAAASVLAKVERDAMMTALAPSFPDYGWDVNKGYATPEHLAALTELGACEHHRRSWRLPPYDSLEGRFGAPETAAGAVVVDDGLMTEVAW